MPGIIKKKNGRTLRYAAKRSPAFPCVIVLADRARCTEVCEIERKHLCSSAVSGSTCSWRLLFVEFNIDLLDLCTKHLLREWSGQRSSLSTGNCHRRSGGRYGKRLWWWSHMICCPRQIQHNMSHWKLNGETARA